MKSKLLIALTATVFALGCTENRKSGSQNLLDKPVAKQTTIENEFAFIGEPQKVVQALSARGIEVEIREVEGLSSWHQGLVKGDGASYSEIEQTVKPVVEHVEPNYVVEANASKDVFAWPKDRQFFKQWALNNIGQSPPFGIPGEPGADMDIMRAWEKTKGSKDVVVAVIDTGCDYTHPELKNNMWVNDKEAPKNGGIAGVDDDGNGYTDDVYGYDFVSSDRTKLWYGKPGDPDPMDEDGHGTHCAGGIGAQANNDVGVAGVNWNVSIMCVRFLGAMGGSSVDAARAILYATAKKVDIMSNSWGGGGESKLIQDAIAEAQKAGVIFVAAAGNDGENTDVTKNYPSGYTKDSKGNPINNIISVGASDNLDNPASFSNYGHRSVDVFAPGVAILSTYPQALTDAGQEPYAVMSGTSMATPYVSGVVALMLAANPSLKGNPEKVKEILWRTADVKESLVGKAVSNGRINAYKAVNEAGDNPTLNSAWQSQPKVIDQRTFRTELVDVRQEIKVEGASAIRVHFDFIQIDDPFDSIYLYDKNFRFIGQVQETETHDFTSPIIPGDTVYVRYVNALVQVVMMNLTMEPSEEACLTKGALEVVAKDGKYSCKIDKESTDDSGENKPYSTFNSEGFSIDRVEFVSAQGGGSK